jgi:hypothetical protein
MTRAGRALENESAFRAMNERIEELESGWESEEPLAFVCECSNPACTTPVYLTLAEYRAVRTDELQFFVVPDHVDPEVEVAVDVSDRYAVVRKLDAEE